MLKSIVFTLTALSILAVGTAALVSCGPAPGTSTPSPAASATASPSPSASASSAATLSFASASPTATPSPSATATPLPLKLDGIPDGTQVVVLCGNVKQVFRLDADGLQPVARNSDEVLIKQPLQENQQMEFRSSTWMCKGNSIAVTGSSVPAPTPTPTVSASTVPTPTPTPTVSASTTPTPTPSPSVGNLFNNTDLKVSLSSDRKQILIREAIGKQVQIKFKDGTLSAIRPVNADPATIDVGQSINQLDITKSGDVYLLTHTS